MNVLTKLTHVLWGLSAGKELTRFIYLALGAFCLLGSFSPLKPLKEGLFIGMVGSKYLMPIKVLSALLMLILVALYSKLLDRFSKQHMLYGFLVFYIALGAVFVYLLSDPVLGVANVECRPDRWVAWGFYLFVDSFITIMLSLFWSFVNDVTSAASAQRGYGMVIFGAQLGGASLMALTTYLIADHALYAVRVPQLVMIALALFSGLAFFVWRVTEMLDGEGRGEVQSTPESVGMLEGLRVVCTRPYVFGMFLLMFFQEMVMSLMFYQQAHMAEMAFIPSLLTKYYFDMNLLFQVLSCVFALFGTSLIHRAIGTRASLMAFPIILFGSGCFYMVWPTLYTISLFIVLLKGLHYAFNQPVRETLYIPTSTDIKYKAKAWIDAVGLRGAKAFGFLIASCLGHTDAIVGGVVMLLVSGWIAIAEKMGRVNERAIARKEIVR